MQTEFVTIVDFRFKARLVLCGLRKGLVNVCNDPVQ